MWIKAQSTMLVNLDNAESVFIDDDFDVIASMKGGRNAILGHYENAAQASAALGLVMSGIIKKPSAIAMPGIEEIQKIVEEIDKKAEEAAEEAEE